MKKTKAIIFDFDGVIHDTFELAYGINLEMKNGDLTRDEYRDIFNGNIYESFDDMNREQEEKEIEKFFVRQNELFKYLKLEGSIKKHLEKLSEKYMLFVVSSNQEETIKEYFHNNNFTHIFKEVWGMETHKSKVEKFKMLFDKYGFGKEECVFVTDTLGDIIEGNKVGVRTIAVDFGFHGRDRLEKGKPFKIVSNFDEIVDVIKSL